MTTIGGRGERFARAFRGAEGVEALRAAVVHQAVEDLRRPTLRRDALAFLVDGAAAWGLEAWPILNKCLEARMINSNDVVEALARAAWQRLEPQLSEFVAEASKEMGKLRAALLRLSEDVDKLRAMKAESDDERVYKMTRRNGKTR